MTGKIEPTTSGTRHQWCRYSGPGRGDCEHFIGLPAVYDETTTDEYGIPNGWCDYCWKAEQTKRLHNEIEALTRRNAELTAALNFARDVLWNLGRADEAVIAAVRRADAALTTTESEDVR